jgi:hypothetical protein
MSLFPMNLLTVLVAPLSSSMQSVLLSLCCNELSLIFLMNTQCASKSFTVSIEQTKFKWMFGNRLVDHIVMWYNTGSPGLLLVPQKHHSHCLIFLPCMVFLLLSFEETYKMYEAVFGGCGSFSEQTFSSLGHF